MFRLLFQRQQKNRKWLLVLPNHQLHPTQTQPFVLQKSANLANSAVIYSFQRQSSSLDSAQKSHFSLARFYQHLLFCLLWDFHFENHVVWLSASHVAICLVRIFLSVKQPWLVGNFFFKEILSFRRFLRA